MKPERISRFLSPRRPEPVVQASEDTLVTDARAGLTPAQMVERKLVELLPSAPLPVSRLRSIAVRRPVS
jgi:hypothetical protein